MEPGERNIANIQKFKKKFFSPSNWWSKKCRIFSLQASVSWPVYSMDEATTSYKQPKMMTGSSSERDGNIPSTGGSSSATEGPSANVPSSTNKDSNPPPVHFPRDRTNRLRGMQYQIKSQLKNYMKIQQHDYVTLESHDTRE